MPAPDQTNQQKWYLSRNGKRAGPFTTSLLKNLSKTGKILPTDLVWQEGSEKPVVASSVKGLLQLATTQISTSEIGEIGNGKNLREDLSPPPQPSSPSKQGIIASIAARIRKLIRIVMITIKISFVVGLILLVVGLAVGIRNAMNSKGTLEVSSGDKQQQILEAKKQVERIENTLAKLETVLNSAKADRNVLAIQLKSLGIKTTSDLRGNTRAKRTAEDIGRLANEIESQEKKVASVASQYQQAKAIVRRMEIEQAGLSEEEMKSLSFQLLETDTLDDGWSKAITPLDTDEAVNSVLSLSDEELSTSYASISAERNKSESSPEKSAMGKGIFAEEFSVDEKDSKTISELQKVFQGFPQSCMSLSVVGKPQILEKTSEKAKIKVRVKVEANQEAYKRFSAQLIPVMQKLSKSSGEFTVKFEGTFTDREAETKYVYGDLETLEKGIPQAFLTGVSKLTLYSGALSVAFEENRTKSGDSIDYRYFMLDHSFQSEIATAASKIVQCKLQLINFDGEVIVTERFTVPSPIASYGSDFLRELGLSTDRVRKYPDEFKPEEAQIFLLGSVFFSSGMSTFRHTTSPAWSSELSLSLDELKSVKDIKIEILP